MGDSTDGNKKLVVVGVCSLLLVALVVAVVVGMNQPDAKDSTTENPQQIKSNAKAVQAICEPTDYKEACKESLASANTTDLRQLVGIAFAATKKRILEAASNSTLLNELEKDPRTKDALDCCRSLAETAADDLERSFNQMGQMELIQVDGVLENLKTWLSAALTYQETCLDGFENTTGDAGDKMKQYLKLGMQLTNNGLAMISQISQALSSIDLDALTGHRRLLSGSKGNQFGYPSWIKPAAKRFLREKGRPIKINLVVAKDGSGSYSNITKALSTIPRNSDKTFVLYIKEGVYEEQVQVDRNLTHLMMIGDGPNKTRITGSLNFIDGVSTFHTATVAILGDNFIASGMGFENSAGAEKHQAVALRVGSDLSIFYNCHMDGYQDTLYTHTYRQFYRNCLISGTIDFIFGDSAVVFQNCTMVVRKPMDNQANIVTAQGRKIDRQPTGIVMQNCSVVADPAYYPVRKTLKSYLARPWKEFSRTIIMESFIDDLITPEGFMPWNATFALDTCFYSEYNNYGPGSSKANRTQWLGIKNINRTEVKQFTANRFLGGDLWVRPRRIPLHPGSTKTNYVPYDSWFTRASPKINETDSNNSTSSSAPSPSPSSKKIKSLIPSISLTSPTTTPSPKNSKGKSPSPSPIKNIISSLSPSPGPNSKNSNPSASPSKSESQGSSPSPSPTSSNKKNESHVTSPSPSPSPSPSNKKSENHGPSSSSSPSPSPTSNKGKNQTSSPSPSPNNKKQSSSPSPSPNTNHSNNKSPSPSPN
ncbi:probable pectinesterase/pectinesterase inhibitor 58 [Impatiens glandulifera]|uniref:probable pectinesterase/pectinesterase inhibitor 58 n=1 Tax=Impatiens glandulifera TaxID=253017 RepID=UPI001FB18399|nr:probable pectinesterase/pectinesterase inhibitor 58 [Impatiens glandulifera]